MLAITLAITLAKSVKNHVQTLNYAFIFEKTKLEKFFPKLPSKPPTKLNQNLIISSLDNFKYLSQIWYQNIYFVRYVHNKTV